MLVCTRRIPHTCPVRLTRVSRALPALVLAAAVLTACGDDTTSDGSDRKPADTTTESTPLNPRTASFAVLDDAHAALALLTQANLGPAFEPDSASGADDPEDPSASATGCDADVSFEDRFDRDGFSLADAQLDFLLFDDARLMVVTSSVSSFGDETTAEAAFDALYEDIGECTHFEESSEEETTVIDVEVDTDEATDDVDAQFDMVGGGTWTFDTQEVPLGVGFAIARIDESVTMVMLLSIGVTEDNALLEPYTEIAADRLAAVAAGETPDDVAAPLPGAGPRVRFPTDDEAKTIEDFLAVAPGIVGD